MKILHIGDIHLGCTLDNQRRHQEFEKTFGFLTEKVKAEHIEAALFSGDVFDNGAPSNDSQNLYYEFLLDLQQAGCRQIIAIAGNHDNANFLEAPQGLLRRMNIHVIGKVDQANLSQEVITLGTEENPAAIVCAVPFLRERDVRGLVPEGENTEEKITELNRGIIKHYQQVYELADARRSGRDIPIIAMGHFYAAGSTFSVSEDTRDAIPYETVGTLDSVDLKNFPRGFAYGALGHIHKPQAVPGFEQWRYAGSLLRMQLRKHMYAPQVILLDTLDLKHPRGIEIPDECFHKMRVIEGNMEELRDQLAQLAAEKEPVWVKPIYTGDEVMVNWQIDLRLEMRDTGIQIIHPEVQHKTTAKKEEPEPAELQLTELTPEQVFLRTLDADPELTSDEQKKIFLDLYRQAQNAVCDPSELKEKNSSDAPGATIKFKRLRFKNVNSLYGETVIDFEDSAFRKGIFLISGDTGSGKTSILDAICLALYGCTPRGSKPNYNHDENLSEGEKEIISELTFSLGKDEYRAFFSHRRTRPGSENPFQDCKQVLYCNNLEIVSSKTEFQKHITALIGLDQKQFNQCVLLAQGSFDAFLKASQNERSGILSNITGTEIYGKIGGEINRRYLKKQEDCATIQKIIKNITLLPEEKRTELNSRLAAARQLQKKQEENIRELERCKQIFCNISMAENDIAEAAAELERLQKEAAAAEPDRIRLNEAKRAQNCLDEFQKCQFARREAENAQKQLSGLEQKYSALVKAAVEAETGKNAAEETVKKISAEQTVKQELFKKIRQLDFLITEKESNCRQASQDLKSAQDTQNGHVRDFRQAEKNWKELQAESSRAQDYLNSHSADHDLETRKAVWEERRKSLALSETANLSEQNQVNSMQKELNGILQELGPLREQERQAEEKDLVQLQQIKNTEEKIRELLRGSTREEIRKNLLNAIQLQAFEERAASYEEDRKKLRSGERCPLCGSFDHPFCDKQELRKAVYSETIEKLQKTISELEKLDKLLEDGNAQKAELTMKHLEIRHRRESLEQDIARQQAMLVKARSLLDEKIRSTAEIAQRLSEEFKQALQTGWTDHSRLPDVLQIRIEAWDNAVRKVELLEKSRQAYENARQTFEQLNAVDAAEVQTRQNRLASLQAELDSLIQRRKEQFNGDVNAAEKELNDRLRQVRNDLETATKKAALAAANAESNRNTHAELTAELNEKLIPMREQQEKRFQEKLLQEQFPDEKTFLDRQMRSEDLQSLDKKLNDLHSARTKAASTLDERRNALMKMKDQLPENAEKGKILEDLKTVSEAKIRTDADVQELAFQLKSDQIARDDVAEQLKKTVELEAEKDLWAYLDDRFGTNGGTRFTRIAQGYTFRNLITLANRNRIGALKQHFTLVSDRNDPLELNVIDHYRGDTVRTAGNLSGGESFEVSLALALGLADMSSISQKASLGNVLLDEGFGTLDDKALDSALDLLMTLRASSGKLVGIISHVEKLKDRIETQINVTSGNGMGMLSGAGVTALAKAAGSDATRTVASGRRTKTKKKSAGPTETQQEHFSF